MIEELSRKKYLFLWLADSQEKLLRPFIPAFQCFLKLKGRPKFRDLGEEKSLRKVWHVKLMGVFSDYSVGTNSSTNHL